MLGMRYISVFIYKIVFPDSAFYLLINSVLGRMVILLYKEQYRDGKI